MRVVVDGGVKADLLQTTDDARGDAGTRRTLRIANIVVQFAFRAQDALEIGVEFGRVEFACESKRRRVGYDNVKA